MDERVLREQEAWDEGFDRTGFEAVWSHAGAYWDEEVDILLKAAFAPHAHGRFLEVGSATWQSWVHRLGTPVDELVCINISQTEIDNGRAALNETSIQPDFQLMDAHALAFEDESFDVVFGKAILHHLDYAVALDEIARVLKPGGTMVFMEPLDFNPVMKLVRHLTPALRTPDEKPIDHPQWRLFEERFDIDLHPVQLAAAAASPVSQRLFKNPQNPLTRAAWELDRHLRSVPGLRLWFRSGLIVGRKRPVSEKQTLTADSLP